MGGCRAKPVAILGNGVSGTGQKNFWIAALEIKNFLMKRGSL